MRFGPPQAPLRDPVYPSLRFIIDYRGVRQKKPPFNKSRQTATLPPCASRHLGIHAQCDLDCRQHGTSALKNLSGQPLERYETILGMREI